MAVELIAERADFPELASRDANSPAPEPRPALTARGEAAVHLIRFEGVWAELGADDRAYFAVALEQLAREAKADR